VVNRNKNIKLIVNITIKVKEYH